MTNKIMTQEEFMGNWKRGEETMARLGPAKTTQRILSTIHGITEHNPDINPDELNQQLENAIYQILQENQQAFFGTRIKTMDVNSSMTS